MITDYKGDEYQRIEYTPYGETWIERTDNRGLEYLPYKFSAKEKDEETGLYYYGARYLDPKYSTWISTDPALGEYIPGAGKGNSKDAGSLPGMGGAYNHINFNLYHYAGNNPVKYTDPTGRNDEDLDKLANLGNDIYSLPSIYELQFKELSKNTQSHINKLDPTIRNDAISMMYELKKEGYSVEIVSSYRSFEEQNSLYSLGRDENGKVVDESKVVTNAKGGQSVHNFKLAFDVEVYKKNDKGRVVKDWNFNGDNWKAVIAKGQEKGFESGSTWSSPYDPPHFQNTHGKTLSQLRQSQ